MQCYLEVGPLGVSWVKLEGGDAMMGLMALKEEEEMVLFLSLSACMHRGKDVGSLQNLIMLAPGSWIS